MAQLIFREMDNKVFYTSQFPTYKFNWNTITNAINYTLKISQFQNLTPNETIKIKEGQFVYQIGKEGMYFAQVEALDSEEKSMAQSELFVFTVSKAPFPPTPLFLDTKKDLESNSNGDIYFELSNFDKKYKVIFEIRDIRGAVIVQSKYITPRAVFKSLPPGTLFATAKYIDDFNQPGESSERHSFIVPEKSAIAAPKLKGIKVR
jgi:hypothetical protein